MLVSSLYEKWDEKRAKRGEVHKMPSDFALDAELAFGKANENWSISDLGNRAIQTVKDQSFLRSLTLQ